MKKFVPVCIFIILIIFFVGQSFLKQENIMSPLPNFLTLSKNDQVKTLELWFPLLSNAEINKDNVQKPEITAKSALIYDLTTNKILFEKNPFQKLPIASLTKIMTAIVAIENYKEEKKFRVAREDLVGENSMGLTEGEVLTFEELLYGLILVSGNDAAETLANKFVGGRENFIKAMNNKARSLGLSNTNFTNPTGLMGDGDQYSTAFDLLIVTKYGMQFPLFRQVVSTFEYSIEHSKNHKAFYFQNETNLLTSYPGAKGVKTGYTPEAGLCLVTYLDYEGHEIIGIILGSESRREEMKDLLDYSLKIQDIYSPTT